MTGRASICVWHLFPKSLLLEQTEIPRRNMENGDENRGGAVCH